LDWIAEEVMRINGGAQRSMGKSGEEGIATLTSRLGEKLSFMRSSSTGITAKGKKEKEHG